MKINVAQSAGFCLGVKRALNIAKGAACLENQVYMLGDIVHNKEVVGQIKKIGIKKINKLTPGKNKTILIRAHGAPLKVYRQAKKFKYKIIDATCPMVKEIHKITQNQEKKGYKIIIIGDKNHAEVKGISGQLKKEAIILAPNACIKKEKFKQEKTAVVVQSTQDIKKVEKIISQLRKKIEKLKFINTICTPTQQKQNEIRKMPLANDIMIIIGSKKSANTKRLYQISKKFNPKSYWVENQKEIKPAWLQKAKNIGISAGSSTPQNSINKATKKIKKIIGQI